MTSSIAPSMSAFTRASSVSGQATKTANVSSLVGKAKTALRLRTWTPIPRSGTPLQ